MADGSVSIRARFELSNESDNDVITSSRDSNESNSNKCDSKIIYIKYHISSNKPTGAYWLRAKKGGGLFEEGAYSRKYGNDEYNKGTFRVLLAPLREWS